MIGFAEENKQSQNKKEAIELELSGNKFPKNRGCEGMIDPRKTVKNVGKLD